MTPGQYALSEARRILPAHMVMLRQSHETGIEEVYVFAQCAMPFRAVLADPRGDEQAYYAMRWLAERHERVAFTTYGKDFQITV